jgi:hypothetical protein
MTMSTPERFAPTLRHKRKPGYDRGPDIEINRPQTIKYFGGSEADDRTETLPIISDATEVLARVEDDDVVGPPEEPELSRPVRRLAYFSAVLLVTSALWAFSGVLAYVGWICWTKVL